MGYITKICPGLANHLTILRQIVVGNGAAGCLNCFAVTDTGNIIGVADTGAILGAAGGLDLRHLHYNRLELCFFKRHNPIAYHIVYKINRESGDTNMASNKSSVCVNNEYTVTVMGRTDSKSPISIF